MQGYHQEPRFAPGIGASSRPALHDGVRKFMSGVYAWMAVGFAITALVAYFVSVTPAAVQLIYLSPAKWLFLFAPLAMSWFLLPRIPNMDRPVALGMFVVFTAMLGAWLGYIPLVYTTASIFMVLGATVGMFAGMSLIGFITKKDLTGLGQFLVMALLGAVIASVLNVLLIGSIGFGTLIAAIVAVVAAGLTAYHTQAIKQFYLMSGGGGNLAILGALLLYVDFINLFTALLRLFGVSRD